MIYSRHLRALILSDKDVDRYIAMKGALRKDRWVQRKAEDARNQGAFAPDKAQLATAIASAVNYIARLRVEFNKYPTGVRSASVSSDRADTGRRMDSAMIIEMEYIT